MDEYKLAKKCVRKLKKYGLSIATAESLTGGMIAERIVSIPGASLVYEEGFVTYSSFSKVKNLLVDPVIIAENGVASYPVAREMAKGVLYSSKTDYALATTGVAGPKSDDYNTKVGTVYISCASKEHVIVRKYHFRGNRDKVRTKSTICAFKLLLYVLKNDL